MTAQNVDIFSGNTVNIIITITDGDDIAVDLAGATISYIIVDKSGTTLLTKTNALSGEISVAVNVATIQLVPSDTSAVFGHYRHELEITDASGNVVTTMTGRVSIAETLQ